MVEHGTALAPAVAWPALPYPEWKDTKDTLLMCLQVVGKVRLALSPFEPQWANVPLYLTARGLTTSPMAGAGSAFEIDVDLLGHQVVVRTSAGAAHAVPLAARPVADFYHDLAAALDSVGVEVAISTTPSEVDDPKAGRDRAGPGPPPGRVLERPGGRVPAPLRRRPPRPSPRRAVLEFLDSTYEAGARLAGWDPRLVAARTDPG